ncbi:expressed unknown protein [Seminavis robusta]|uniref:Uncharacterized protein n=1 Tax=Seminavis robusta TaxID=568900 RepID=A0A9N8H9R2_9STRA|nr:expressed unknown protein [Seminavis robusta]|eukprot:Sro288_g108740.1 n/a (325) ;mRNA; f:24249-25292
MTNPVSDHVDTNKSQTRKPDLAKVKVELRLFLSAFSVWDFLDPRKPWVLVPRGSPLGVFDFVPPVFREGPWAVLPIVYIASTVYLASFSTVYHCAKYGFENLPQGHYDAFTAPWYLNLAGFLWTLYVFCDVFVSGFGAASVATFTVQSYFLLCLRYGLSALAPFVESRKLAVVNELLRYPVLNQATITFVVFNAILAPVCLVCLVDGEKRKNFIKYCTNFRLIQLHCFNIVFAVYSGVWGSPQRSLQWTDLHAAAILTLQYGLFYIFILDRLGIHLYLIISPRTNVSLISWFLITAATLGLHSFWDDIIKKYGGYWDSSLTVAE